MIRLSTLQAGRGADRPLVVVFHASPPVVLGALAGPLADAYVLLGLANQGGYSVPPAWETILQAARVGGWSSGPVVLVGYSAGCAAVRELCRHEDIFPDVVVALDGTSGPRSIVPAAAHTLDPWRALAGWARRGQMLLVATHTYQTYTEKMPAPERFPATVSVLRSATGWELPALPAGAGPRETREGDLVVLSYGSKAIDREAHIAQQTAALPHVFAQYVAPWLTARAGAEDTEPELERDGTGEAALEVALQELVAGVREEPLGSNTGPRIREYLSGCVRDLDGDGDEEPLRLGAAEWCAAFVGWCDAHAGVQRPWRAAVAEICRDARRDGTLREVEAYEPQPGDLAVFGRAGQDPRRGGLGHVGRVERVAGDLLVTIDGNHGTHVARVERSLADPALVAWVEYPRRAAPPERWTAPPAVLGGVMTTSDLATGRTPGAGPESFTNIEEGPALPG